MKRREAVIARLTLQTNRSRLLASAIGATRRIFARWARQFFVRYSHSLRVHLAGLVLLAMLPVLIVSVIIGEHASNLAATTREQRRADTARALAGAVDQRIAITIAAITALANSSALQASGDPADFAIRTRTVSDALGMPITLQWGTATPDTDEIDARALASGRAELSDLSQSPRNQMPMADLVVPVMHNGIGIATLHVLLSRDQLALNWPHQTNQPFGQAVLLDRHDRVAAASHEALQLAGQIFDAGPADGSTQDPTTSSPLAHAPGWRVLYREAEASGGLIIGNPMRETLLMFLLAAAASVSLALLFAGRLIGPLQALTGEARNVAIGGERTGTPMRPSDITELEALRHGLVRADAVLRRRGAAERMALREARTGQELLISVVNGTAESIYVKDLELRYVLVNRAALLSGPQPRAEWQVLGRGTIDLFPPVVARRIEAADRSVLATGRMTSFEQEYPPEVGSSTSRWVAMTIAPWQDAEGRVVGVVSVSRDITASKQAESRVRAMQADLLRATRLSAMGAMASGLAHELNQPLAAATNYLNAGSRLLECGMAGDTASFPAARGAVIGGVEQLLRAGAIVRRLRDFVERGEAELQPERIERVLRESCDLARTDGIDAGVDLRLDLTHRTGMAMIDRTQIQQVLLNLIRNAAEAICSAEPGSAVGITLGMTLGEIDVSARTDDTGDLCIEVRDTGPGLPNGIAERLFQPFVSSKRTGMGIGLSICRTIIEGHGGRLTAEPRHPNGMIFRIILPALHPPGESP